MQISPFMSWAQSPRNKLCVPEGQDDRVDSVFLEHSVSCVLIAGTPPPVSFGQSLDFIMVVYS
jgi:hypothetical protein